MKPQLDQKFSPYRTFTAKQWGEFRADTPLTLTAQNIERLRSLNDPINLEEVARIYVALSKLLSAHVESSQLLFEQRKKFLALDKTSKTPFIIGIAGSVAVGKSTTARLLRELLRRWPSSPSVAHVTTDGFLYPNEILQQKGLMERKGFPESYNLPMLLDFLTDIKAGRKSVKAPFYSHLIYDCVPDQFITVDRPDILIFEGLNVLQSRELPQDGSIIPMVSDYFDFSIYIDAEPPLIHKWYVERFMKLRATAFLDPKSFFHRYTQISDSQALEIATQLWTQINFKNLMQNIAPTRPRADLILTKGDDHLIKQVSLRKL
jgi:type I pantothenate kinase